jgi:hypothetical protein
VISTKELIPYIADREEIVIGLTINHPVYFFIRKAIIGPGVNVLYPGVKDRKSLPPAEFFRRIRMPEIAIRVAQVKNQTTASK